MHSLIQNMKTLFCHLTPIFYVQFRQTQSPEGWEIVCLVVACYNPLPTQHEVMDALKMHMVSFYLRSAHTQGIIVCV